MHALSVVRLWSRAPPGPHWPHPAEPKRAEPPVLFRGKEEEEEEEEEEEKKKKKKKKKKRGSPFERYPVVPIWNSSMEQFVAWSTRMTCILILNPRLLSLIQFQADVETLSHR